MHFFHNLEKINCNQIEKLSYMGKKCMFFGGYRNNYLTQKQAAFTILYYCMHFKLR